MTGLEIMRGALMTAAFDGCMLDYASFAECKLDRVEFSECRLREKMCIRDRGYIIQETGCRYDP